MNLEQQIADLKVTDTNKDDVKQSVDILMSKKPELKVDQKVLEKVTSTKSGLKALHNVFRDNIEQLVDGFISLNQSQLLIKVLKESLDQDADGVAALEVIKTKLKKSPTKDNLTAYYALISAFNSNQYQHIPLILSFLTPELDEELVSLALIITVQYLKADKEKAGKAIKEYLDTFDEVLDLSQLLNFDKVMELLYAVIPDIIEPVFLSPTTLQIIKEKTDEIVSNTTGLSPNQRKIVLSILKLVNSSCITETARASNSKKYVSLLKLGASIKDPEIRLLSTLTIIKLWNFVKLKDEISVEHLYDNLVDQIDSEESIEGLAYLSLNKKITKKMRADEDLVEKLLLMFGKTKNYGLLVIFSNLVKLPELEGGDKKTVNYLKNMSTPGGEAEEEDRQAIQLFNKELLEQHRIVDIICKLKVHEDDLNLVPLMVTIIYNLSLSSERTVKLLLVKQGALNVIIAYLMRNTAVEKDKTKPIEDLVTDVRHKALQSLAKILIGVNPTIVFNKYDPKTAAVFLVELLNLDSRLDHFEALLALTNLATIADLKKIIIVKAFPFLDGFIIDSSSEPVQKASWELVSNLIMEPEMLVKFFNIEEGSADSKSIKTNRKRLLILIKLLHSHDEKLQITIAGLLVNASSLFDMIAMILMKDTEFREELLNIITAIFTSQQNVDLLLRLSYLLLNLTYADKEAIRKRELLMKALSAVLKIGNREITEVVVEIIKELK